MHTYKPIRLLGQGGYGAVWLVTRISDGALFAAKIIQKAKCKRESWCPERATMVPDEILLSERLEHPNLLHLHQLYREQDCWVLVMDYLPGFVDLFEYVNKQGPLPVTEARHILTQLLDICGVLISLDIDHRDIKDENILYNPATRVIKLIDFGSASRIPDTPYTRYQGTKVYIPPEYFKHGAYSALPATTWSIGCLAYTLLNGDSPFKTRREVEEHTSLRFINKSLDQETKEFLQDLLAVEEEDRMLPGEIIFHPWMDWIAKE